MRVESKVILGTLAINLGILGCVQPEPKVTTNFQPIKTKVELGADDVGDLTNPDNHSNIIGAVYQFRGEGMFVPTLAQKAQQGGSTFQRIIDLDQQIIPVGQVERIRRKIPGSRTDVFIPFEPIPSTQTEVHAIARAETINNQTGQIENFLLLANACEVQELPSNEQTRALLRYYPAGVDLRTKIVLPQECWVMEKRPPFSWVGPRNEGYLKVVPNPVTIFSKTPRNLPATGRKD